MTSSSKLSQSGVERCDFTYLPEVRRGWAGLPVLQRPAACGITRIGLTA